MKRSKKFANKWSSKNSQLILNQIGDCFPIQYQESIDLISGFIKSCIVKGVALDLDFLRGNLLINTRKVKLQDVIIEVFKILELEAQKSLKKMVPDMNVKAEPSKSKTLALYEQRRIKEERNLAFFNSKSKVKRGIRRKKAQSFPAQTTLLKVDIVDESKNLIRERLEEFERIKKRLSECTLYTPGISLTETAEDPLHQ